MILFFEMGWYKAKKIVSEHPIAGKREKKFNRSNYGIFIRKQKENCMWSSCYDH